MKIHHDNNKGSAPGISKEFPSIAKDHDERPALKGDRTKIHLDNPKSSVI